MLVDSHCHINFPELAADIDGVVSRMTDAKVGGALCVSVNVESLDEVIGLAERFDSIWASAGVHPDQTDGEEPTVERLQALLAHPRVIATGETGLDYYRLKGDLEWQRERFRTHIRAAKLAGKPLIIHTREAAKDTIRIMRAEGADAVGGVMHCFTETWETAKAALDLGFMISFSGILTFKKAEALRDVAGRVPDNRLLIETDSPYLAPVPHRGRTNEPSYVRYVASELGRIRNLAAEAVAEITTDNFFRLFPLAQR
jgi:TatD DNase family protein